MLYSKPQRDTESDHWAGGGREGGRNLSAVFLPISCFLSLKAHHPISTACVIWTLDTPLDTLRKSDPTLCKEAFHPNLEVVKKVTGHPQEVEFYGPHQGWSSAGTAEVD